MKRSMFVLSMAMAAVVMFGVVGVAQATIILGNANWATPGPGTFVQVVPRVPTTHTDFGSQMDRFRPWTITYTTQAAGSIEAIFTQMQLWDVYPAVTIQLNGGTAMPVTSGSLTVGPNNITELAYVFSTPLVVALGDEIKFNLSQWSDGPAYMNSTVGSPALVCNEGQDGIIADQPFALLFEGGGAVPEPAALGLIGAALLALARRRRA